MVVKTSWSINGIISAHAKFHPNRINNREVENFHFWSILFGWAGRLINGRRHFKLILSCVFSMFSSIAKFHPNRTKNMEVEIFTFGRIWWVGLVGQKMVVGISNSFYVVFGPLLAPLPNFIKIT